MQLVIIDTGISKTKLAIATVTAVLGAYQTRYPGCLFIKKNTVSLSSLKNISNMTVGPDESLNNDFFC